MWTFDAANTGVTENDVDATVTYTQTVGTLTNGIIFAWHAWSATAVTVTGVTCNGVAMTEAKYQGTNRGVALYYFIGPSSGTNTIVWSGSGNFSRSCAGSHSWSGANSSQSLQTINGSGTSANPSITCGTGTDEMVIDCIGISFTAGDTLTVDADQTERGKVTGGATTGASSSQLGSAGGVMSWTDSNSRAYGYVAASFDGAPAAAAPKHLAILGVG